MSLFLVRMDHPDGDAWGEHVVAHLAYLKGLIEAGKLLASGPLKGTALRTGYLIFAADSHAEVERLVDGDPFAQQGLIAALRIEEWDPHFGVFSPYSSGDVPPGIAAMFAR